MNKSIVHKNLLRFTDVIDIIKITFCINTCYCEQFDPRSTIFHGLNLVCSSIDLINNLFKIIMHMISSQYQFEFSSISIELEKKINL